MGAMASIIVVSVGNSTTNLSFPAPLLFRLSNSNPPDPYVITKKVVTDGTVTIASPIELPFFQVSGDPNHFITGPIFRSKLNFTQYSPVFNSPSCLNTASDLAIYGDLTLEGGKYYVKPTHLVTVAAYTSSCVGADTIYGKYGIGFPGTASCTINDNCLTLSNTAIPSVTINVVVRINGDNRSEETVISTAASTVPLTLAFVNFGTKDPLSVKYPQGASITPYLKQ